MMTPMKAMQRVRWRPGVHCWFLGMLLGLSQVASGEALLQTKHFELHSDPWINLHHFLYQWSRAEEGLGSGRQEVYVSEREEYVKLGGSDRRAWDGAISFYRASIAHKDHFSTDMLELKAELVERSKTRRGPVPDHIPGVADALQSAMTVYRYVWWPAHDRANREWIDTVRSRLSAHEDRLVERTAAIYTSAWPDERFRVDVSAYANFRAGYTASGHVMIYSTDSGNQGQYALETLFHEVQHTRSVGGPMRARLKAMFAAVDREVPENLWHAMIFATAGELARQAAAEDGLPRHEPYWSREGFVAWRAWKSLVPVVNELWVPAVAGETDAEAALVQLVLHFDMNP